MGKRKSAKTGKAALATGAVEDFKRMTEARRKRQRAQWKSAVAAGPVVETPERRRHAAAVVDWEAKADDGGLPGAGLCRRTRSPLDLLMDRKVISRRMHTAGTILRGHYEAAAHLTPSSDVARRLPIKGRGGGGGLEPSERQIAAADAARAALRGIGPHVGAVAVAVCCHDMGLAEIGRQWRQDRQEIAGVLKAGLKTLADHYGLTGEDDEEEEKESR